MTRILAFSDLHADAAMAVLLVAAARDADLVLGAGDFCNLRHGLSEVMALLSPMAAKAVYVAGNAESAGELRAATTALVLHGQAATKAGNSDSGNGIDRALLHGYGKPVEEFEGAATQLAIFDKLPESTQRRLLSAALTDPKEAEQELARMAQAWSRADLGLIDRETNEEFLSDPVLREALLVSRNRAWEARLIAMLRAGAHPFVAVGTAHLVGKDGLPAQLAANGYKVTRLQ